MGLFGKSKEEREYQKERKEVKSQVEKLMKAYDKEEIDGDTYFKSMMNLTTSHRKKK